MRKRWLRVLVVSVPLLALAACGFHLRRGAQLPPGMQRVHLSVDSSGDLDRELARQLEISGADLVDAPGKGVAEMIVPSAVFHTAALTYTGQARIGEYVVRYKLRFHVLDGSGKEIVPMQEVVVSREFTYDARDPVGTETQTEQLHKSMVSDAVQSVMFRLQAAAKHAGTSVAPASSSAGH